MLTTVDLAGMRDQQEQALPETVDLSRPSGASDGAGGADVGYDVLGSYACRISPSGNSPTVQVLAERLGIEIPWLVTMPEGTDVCEGDRLHTADGRVLEVVGVVKGGSWETARRVACVELS